jgi:hypothetical protein
MRLSSRLPQHFQPNALTAELERLREAGAPWLDLTVSNPTRCGFDYPEAGIRAALNTAETLRYAPDPRGALHAREAIAAWHGHGVRSEDVLLTASTSEAYSWLFKLLGDPGDGVLVSAPSYPLFEWLARLEGLAALPVPAYFADRWHLDLGALEAACGPRTRAVVVVNPNNPTGHFLSRGEWGSLLELCTRRDLALIVDEVFADYALEPAPDALPTGLEEAAPRCPVFILSGLSKVAALPQIKLGWIIARGAAAKELLEPLAFIADQFLSVSAPAQAAASALLGLAPRIQDPIRTRLKSNLAVLDESLTPFPHLSRLPVEGGWSVLLRRPAIDSDEACALRILRQTSVMVQPGHFFDLPSEAFLVLSLLAAPPIFREGIARLLPAI